MNLTAVLTNTTLPAPMKINTSIDITLSVICFIVFLVGTPGNLLAMFYFISCGRDLPTRLYTLLSFIDFIISIFILPVGLSLVQARDPVMFGWPPFCTLWGLVWTWAPYMSVFLIAVLSITRTLVLLNPLRIISKRLVMVIVGLYGVWIAVRMLTPVVVEGPEFSYLKGSVECMWQSENEVLNEMSLITVIVFLANPILPILLSCVISTYVIMKSIQRLSNASSGQDKKRNATITILILTGTYLFLNFPLFIYLAGFTFYYVSHRQQDWLGGDITLDNYLWNFVYVILIGVNSLANVLVYLCRIRNFRTFLGRQLLAKKQTVRTTIAQLSPRLSTEGTPQLSKSPSSLNHQLSKSPRIPRTPRGGNNGQNGRLTAAGVRKTHTCDLVYNNNTHQTANSLRLS